MQVGQGEQEHVKSDFPTPERLFAIYTHGDLGQVDHLWDALAGVVGRDSIALLHYISNNGCNFTGGFCRMVGVPKRFS